MAQARRMTKQRSLILSELRKLTSHPTADEMYNIVRKKMPRISLGTVYRNLDLLAGDQEILKLEHAGFQKRFDGNIMPHQHVRCTHCGKVADVMPPVSVPEMPDAMAVPGFEVTSASLEFYGTCADCAKNM